MSEVASSLTIERYELKYLIEKEWVTPLSSFIESYCELDPYSRKAPQNFYTVNNLYLDTASSPTLMNRETRAFQFDLRVRSYGKDQTSPVSLEIKYQVRDFVKKKRSVIERNAWLQSLGSGFFPEHLEEVSRRNLEDFAFLVEAYKMEPTLFTQYQRKAYQSCAGDGGRITLDQNLCFQTTRDWRLHAEGGMISDNSGAVILELKWEKKIPLWMVDLVRRFELQASSFSKFDHSLVHLHKAADSAHPVFLQSR